MQWLEVESGDAVWLSNFPWGASVKLVKLKSREHISDCSYDMG